VSTSPFNLILTSCTFNNLISYLSLWIRHPSNFLWTHRYHGERKHHYRYWLQVLNLITKLHKILETPVGKAELGTNPCAEVLAIHQSFLQKENPNDPEWRFTNCQAFAQTKASRRTDITRRQFIGNPLPPLTCNHSNIGKRYWMRPIRCREDDSWKWCD
jgi:hypothetical protein